MPADSAAAMPRPTGVTPVPLAQLAALAGAPPVARGVADIPISGVSMRTGAVRPGDLFAALPGTMTHGARFVGEALSDGARAVITDADGAAIVRSRPGGDEVPIVIVGDPRAPLGILASRVYGDPSHTLDVIGVTGTSGKTTTCYLLEGAFAAVGRHVGLIGTVQSRIGATVLPSSLTTPEAPELQALFAVMRERGVDTVVMEVSSHALVRGRVDGTRFALAAFTNLSQEHLDFHGDMEHYFAAKGLLFDGRARREVVVVNDDYGRRLAAGRPAAITVSTHDGHAAPCPEHPQWSGRAIARSAGVQQLTIEGPDGLTLGAEIGLPGSFNVTNAVTAVAAVWAVGGDPARAATGLAAVRVPGRMERVDEGQPFLALVDYAHKPAALAAALDAARAQSIGRVIAVIGAGGDRDTGKRPEMGRVAARRADVVIVTDDNPRSEDPATIRAQIRDGMEGGRCDVTEVADRAQAINAAVTRAEAGDVVIVAGKGHETGQEIRGHVYPFSDRDALRAALGRRDETRGRG